jgi:restriction endonuclease S subunit
LLEGLDISIKKFSETSNDGDETLRLDAEHYQSKYERIEEKIARGECCTLRELLASPVITGHTPSMKIDRFYGGDICFVKTDNVRENKIVAPFTDYLTDAGNADVVNSQLAVGDIVLTIIGATFDVVGRSAIVRDSHLPANINQNIALIRLDKTKINSNYLSAYLNTKYGRGTLHHHSRQTEQVNLNCREVERISVPLFRQLEISVSSATRAADATADDAALAFTQAEELLLKELGIEDFSASNAGVNVKSLKETFGITGRLDAEYYQPKYQTLLALLRKDGLTIADVASLRSERFQKPLNGNFQYLEIGSLRSEGTVVAETVACADAPSRASQIVRKGDVITSTVRPIRRLSALVSNQQDGNVCSSGFVVLQPSRIAAEALLVYLRLPAICELMDLHTSASLYPAISEKDLLGLPIPAIPKATQNKIASLVQQSFSLKIQSERLLEAAKRAVEIAIEQDEAAGMAYLARENSIE